jgi:hypothetical protein
LFCGGGNTGAGSCGTLPPEFDCSPGATGPGVLDVSFVDIGVTHQINELGGLTCVTGSLYVYSTSLTDLTGLDTLQLVGGSVYIDYNASLVSVAGLDVLESITGELGISNNASLTTLENLGSLTYVGLDFDIYDNENLPACWTSVLEAQTGATCEMCTGNNGTGTCD